jgi:hypothetical protein
VSGFPIAWEDAPSLDQLSDLCPYTLREIGDYLFGHHYHWVLDEGPTTFSVSGPCAQRTYSDRRYWLFEARDNAKQRQWLVVVGTGKSPFDPCKKMRRWIYANTNENDLSPDDFLDQEYREQLLAGVRSG